MYKRKTQIEPLSAGLGDEPPPPLPGQTTAPAQPPVAESVPEEPPPGTIFFVGQHEIRRTTPVTDELLSHAQDLGYDFLTTQITNSDFYSRVLALTTAHFDAVSKQNDPSSFPLPLISPLTPAETTLYPDTSNSSLIGIISPWLDLGSSDPLIAHISRQVFQLEVAYAAFCGINNVVLYGPTSAAGVIRFARAVREALRTGPFLQIHILCPMMVGEEPDYGDSSHLSAMARISYVNEDEEFDEPDLYGAWDAWNTIRTMCDYSQKLFIGKVSISLVVLPALTFIWHKTSRTVNWWIEVHIEFSCEG